MPSTFEIPPDAVRVWRGFRAPTMAVPDFYTRLGTVFVPATVEMQIKIGLDTYIPTALAGMASKPAATPDETAILFWDSQQTYKDGFLTLAVRTYTLTHAAVYTPDSRADFPLLFAGQVTSNQPVYLVNKSADWMKGAVSHLVGSRPDATTPDQFHANVATALGAIQKTAGLAGGIACCGDDYLVFWALDAPGGQAAATAVSSLASLCGWSHVIAPAPTTLPKGLWEQWPGLTMNPGDSLNVQFTRRWEA